MDTKKLMGALVVLLALIGIAVLGAAMMPRLQTNRSWLLSVDGENIDACGDEPVITPGGNGLTVEYRDANGWKMYRSEVKRAIVSPSKVDHCSAN
jgi:hypothetical protein